MTGNYYVDLFQVLCENFHNDHRDNYDHFRFGDNEKKEKLSLKNWINKKLNQKKYFNKFELESFAKSLDQYLWIEDFKYLYDLLDDQHSKWLLLQIIAYRILGYRKVRLPLSTKKYWEDIERIKQNENKKDYIQINFMGLKLYFNDLHFLNIPIKLYFFSEGINTDFIIKQYELNRENIKISADVEDVVIDGGGCFGDTALYFADKVGRNGAVHSFEFIPDNINIWEKNIGLNPDLESSITLMPSPLWSDSNINVYYKSDGPGSKVSFDKFDGYDGMSKTLSIDDFVRNKAISKIDFIKLDIEGAELRALQGAINTLQTFKPKLAIALYHSVKDFYTIPKFLKELNLGYHFYLSHATIHAEETMLFAIAER
jgi:FkbM family methyltransferase